MMDAYKNKQSGRTPNDAGSEWFGSTSKVLWSSSKSEFKGLNMVVWFWNSQEPELNIMILKDEMREYSVVHLV